MHYNNYHHQHHQHHHHQQQQQPHLHHNQSQAYPDHQYNRRQHQQQQQQQHHHHHNQQQQHQNNDYICSSKQSVLNSQQRPSRYHYRYVHDFDDIDERIFEYNNHNTNYTLARSYLSQSPSPIREPLGVSRKHHSNEKRLSDYEYDEFDFDGPKNAEDFLKLKWMDNGPRMSRVRDHKNKRLITRLEQFDLWDAEQEQKQKQFELAREQRYRNIVDRLKTQDFCLDQMRRRHESDIETSRNLEVYEDEHLYVDPLENSKPTQRGPISQFRKFQAEMDIKLRSLQRDLDTLNPRTKIEQSILPRLERTRGTYSVEPEIYTSSGKRILKRPARQKKGSSKVEDVQYHYEDDDDSKCVKFYYPSAITEEDLRRGKARLELENDKRKLKSIIQQSNNNNDNNDNNNNNNKNVDESLSKLKLSSNEKKVCFEDDVAKQVDLELSSEMVVKNNDEQQEQKQSSQEQA